MNDRPGMTKQQAIEMAPEGWTYCGFLDGHYMYQTGDYKDGFYAMYCLPEDMENHNLQYMADHKLTRIIKNT